MSITPKNEPHSDKPDALSELYRQAVADDRGPSVQSSAAILDRARQRMMSQEDVKQESQPAANDRFWLRHAVGGLAAIGLVGWLMLQHATWWDGAGRSMGTGPDVRPAVVAESAAPASPALPASPEPSAPSPAVTDAAATAADQAVATKPVTSRGERQVSVAANNRENSEAVQAGKASEAMNMEAPASAPPSVAAAMPVPDSMRERSARAAPMAKAPAPSRDAADKRAAEKSLETSDAALQQNPVDQGKLPLCPMDDDVQHRNSAAKAGAATDAKAASALASKTPLCRPRKPSEKRPAKPAQASEATEGVAEQAQ